MGKAIGYAALTISMLFIGISVGNDLIAMFVKTKPKAA